MRSEKSFWPIHYEGRQMPGQVTMKGIDRTILVDILRGKKQAKGNAAFFYESTSSFLTTREEAFAAIEHSESSAKAFRVLKKLLEEGKLHFATLPDEEYLRALGEACGPDTESPGHVLLKAAGASDVCVAETAPAYTSYGRQQIDASDIMAVNKTLSSDFLTCGPAVDEFEKNVSTLSGVRHGVAVSSGTAALHCVMNALSIGPGDEVIVPPLTFSASANSIVYEGGTPVFADIASDTLTLDPISVAQRITSRTKAIVAVDYAGQPCDYVALRRLADEHGLKLVADACHSIGGAYEGRPVGSLADVTVFSFHPVKHVTCGEGGMIVTDDKRVADAARKFRNHGISRDFHGRAEAKTFDYDIEHIGYNYRLPDINATLGVSQVKRLDDFVARRRELATLYRHLLKDVPGISMTEERDGSVHAYHLFVILIDADVFGMERDTLLRTLKADNIGVNVHYPLVHLLTAYRRDYGTKSGLCPVAESVAERVLTLPLHPGMADKDVRHVVACTQQAAASVAR